MDEISDKLQQDGDQVFDSEWGVAGHGYRMSSESMQSVSLGDISVLWGFGWGWGRNWME